MNPLSELALAGGLAWGSGIRLYATLLIVGVLGHYGVLHLPPALVVLQHPWVIGAAAVMTVGEFLADKVPAFDSVWDAVHTFLRPLAGAYVFSSSDVSTSTIVLALIGGALALTAHGAKASTRLLVNASPDEKERLALPHDFVLTDWDHLDFLAWRDPRTRGRGGAVAATIASVGRCTASSWITRSSRSRAVASPEGGGARGAAPRRRRSPRPPRRRAA